jgi:hypothetical protein
LRGFRGASSSTATCACIEIQLDKFLFNIIIIIFIIILSEVRLSPLVTEATTGLLYQPQMIDDGDCGSVCGM